VNDAPEPAGRHFHRPPTKADFEGKIIRRFQRTANNIWRFWFSDGSAFAIQCKVNGVHGVSFMELCDECIATGDAILHPCAGYSPIQKKVFETIAGGKIPPCRSNTLNRLLGDGLIVRAGRRKIGEDRFGDITADAYALTPAAKAQWLAWCEQRLSGSQS
jgi:hypothetical protein